MVIFCLYSVVVGIFLIGLEFDSVIFVCLLFHIFWWVPLFLAVLTQVLQGDSSLSLPLSLAKLLIPQLFLFCVDGILFLYPRDGLFLPHDSIISCSSGTMLRFSLPSPFLLSAAILFVWRSLFWSSLMWNSFLQFRCCA